MWRILKNIFFIVKLVKFFVMLKFFCFFFHFAQESLSEFKVYECAVCRWLRLGAILGGSKEIDGGDIIPSR